MQVRPLHGNVWYADLQFWYVKSSLERFLPMRVCHKNATFLLLPSRRAEIKWVNVRHARCSTEKSRPFWLSCCHVMHLGQQHSSVCASSCQSALLHYYASACRHKHFAMSGGAIFARVVVHRSMALTHWKQLAKWTCSTNHCSSSNWGIYFLNVRNEMDEEFHDHSFVFSSARLCNAVNLQSCGYLCAWIKYLPCWNSAHRRHCSAQHLL